MKYEALRLYINSRNLQKEHHLKGTHLVIDGKSYFHDAYRKSGCNFIYGAECDKYAQYLIKEKLIHFIENNVTCFVIFNGSTGFEMGKRKAIHQNIIDDLDDELELSRVYFEPLFAKDVEREVLDALGIKYFYTEHYDSTEATVSIAKKFKCPILTNNIEYCLYGVSCIPPKSVTVNDDNEIVCSIYDHANIKTTFGLYDKTPLLLALLDENGVNFHNLAEIIQCEDKGNIVWSTVRWLKKHRKDALDKTIKQFHDESQRNTFLCLYNKIKVLFLFTPGTLAVKHFIRKRDYGLFKDDKRWFAKGVGIGRIAVPYIDLKRNGTCTGSQLVYDRNKPDAMLAAIKIISYSHCLLTNTQAPLSFIGRQSNICANWEIFTKWENKISNRKIFTERKKILSLLSDDASYPFKVFLKETLPGFNQSYLQKVPISSRNLILSLLYYVCNVNNDFNFGAYCVLLCYVMLNESEFSDVFVQKSSKYSLNIDNLDLNSLDGNCRNVSSRLSSFFHVEKSVQKFDRNLLHSLAEFQHCFQHMNYLKRLCGSEPTNYCTTFNGTFVYNVILNMKNKDYLMEFLEEECNDSSVLTLYKRLVLCFETCLSEAY